MPRTYSQLYIDTRKALKDAGVEAHSLEARLLVCRAAEKSSEELLRDLSLYASKPVEEALAAFMERRLKGEPVAYILGEWEFFGMSLEVNRDVLIPRADTETLVETALALLRGRNPQARILDLCCGSGCIGLAMARELPGARLVMIDKSLKALEVCRRNIRRHGLSSRAVCMEADALAPPADNLGSFDVIISNPPYIAGWEILQLDSSVRDYEPRSALDGGTDGLDFYRYITREWRKALRSSGWLLFEVGETQAEEVKTLLRLAGFKSVESIKDTAGHDRVVFGRI